MDVGDLDGAQWVGGVACHKIGRGLGPFFKPGDLALANPAQDPQRGQKVPLRDA